MQPQVRYLEVPQSDAGMRLDNFLRRQLKSVPKSLVYKIIRSGEVRVNRGRVRPSKRVSAGDKVRLPPLRTRSQTAGSAKLRPPDNMIERATSAIISEAPDYLLMDKPPDMAVHAGSGVDFGLIECLRAARPNEYLDLVHRLDRGTSGALLVARSQPARRQLADALVDPRARKTYLALLDGHWPDEVIRVNQPLNSSAEFNDQARVRVDSTHGKTATSEFRVIARSGSATLVKVDILTGRKHQIRAHAAYFDCPVAGDGRYGDSKRATGWRRQGLKRPFLHAFRLQIPRGDGWLTAEVALADDLERVIQYIGLSNI